MENPQTQPKEWTCRQCGVKLGDCYGETLVVGSIYFQDTTRLFCGECRTPNRWFATRKKTTSGSGVKLNQVLCAT